MLLAGLNLHGLIGACLLQPVKKHLTKSTDPEDVEENPNELPQQLVRAIIVLLNLKKKQMNLFS